MCIDSATSALKKKGEKIRRVYVEINEEEISHYSPHLYTQAMSTYNGEVA